MEFQATTSWQWSGEFIIQEDGDAVRLWFNGDYRNLCRVLFEDLIACSFLGSVDGAVVMDSHDGSNWRMYLTFVDGAAYVAESSCFYEPLLPVPYSRHISGGRRSNMARVGDAAGGGELRLPSSLLCACGGISAAGRKTCLNAKNRC